MTVDIERVLRVVVSHAQTGLGVSLVGLASYVIVGVVVVVGNAHWQYPVLSLRADPVLNALFVCIGVSAAVMSAALVFLAGISTANATERAVVVLAGSLGVGFGASLVRITLPVVIQYLSP